MRRERACPAVWSSAFICLAINALSDSCASRPIARTTRRSRGLSSAVSNVVLRSQTEVGRTVVFALNTWSHMMLLDHIQFSRRGVAQTTRIAIAGSFLGFAL